MLGGLVIGAFIVAAIGDYRGVLIVAGGLEDLSWSDIEDIDFSAALFQTVFRGEEIRNAVRDIYIVNQGLAFDFGLSQWNNLVFSYIPAQFLGAEFKQFLMLSLENEQLLRDAYIPQPGTTHTGMADAFASFWFLGAGLFLAIGHLFGRLYRGAMQGHFGSQIVFIALITPGLHAITHGTRWFVSELVFIVIFVGPLLWAAKKPIRIRAGFAQSRTNMEARTDFNS